MTAESKEVIASVSENEQQKGRGFKSQMFLGELPRPEEFKTIGEASKTAFAEGVYREGEDDREEEDTPQTVP